MGSLSLSQNQVDGGTSVAPGGTGVSPVDLPAQPFNNSHTRQARRLSHRAAGAAPLPFPRLADRADAIDRVASASRPLKVCITSRAPFVGGAELAAERLARGLMQQGHDVFCLLGKKGEVFRRFTDAGIRCMHFPVQYTDVRRFWRYLGARNTLRSLFRRERPDVIHANDLPSAQLFFDAARGLDIARVCHHRFIYDRAAIDWFNKYSPDRHLFVSAALRDTLAATSPALAAQPNAVVYDGLELPRIATAADQSAARAELGLPNDRVIVTFAGQIIERKGVADLLHAWALLMRDGRTDSTGETPVPPQADVAPKTPITSQPRAELVIVGDDVAGDGAYRRKMEQLAAELRITPRFVGFQRNVDRWLTASNIAVVPSHVEPLGNATLEAMSHSLPVVGAKVGGIPEMIVHEETGLLAPPHDPPALAEVIGKLIAWSDLRRQLGFAARMRCESLFSLEAHTRAVLHQYDLARGVERQRRAA